MLIILILFLNLVKKLLNHIKIKNHFFALNREKLFLYDPFYRLKLIKIEDLKTYIKINFTYKFI